MNGEFLPANFEYIQLYHCIGHHIFLILFTKRCMNIHTRTHLNMSGNSEANGGVTILCRLVCVTTVEDSVVLLHEELAHNPERAAGLGDVKTHEAGLGSAERRVANHVVLGVHVELVEAVAVLEHVRELGKARNLHTGLVRDGIDDGVNLVGRSGHQRSARVNDSSAEAVGTVLAQVKALASNLDIHEVKLPVELLVHLDVADLTLVEVAVGLAENDVALLLGAASGKVEGEHVVGEKVLRNDIVEDRLVTSSGKRREGQTEDTIKLEGGEDSAFSMHNLAEGLLLHVNRSEVEGVVTQVALDATRTKLHSHLNVLLAERLGHAGLELAVKLASGGSALTAHDPKVGRTSVENNLEHLTRVANLNDTHMLGLTNSLKTNLVLLDNAVLVHLDVTALEAEVREDLGSLLGSEVEFLSNTLALLLLISLDIDINRSVNRGLNLAIHLNQGARHGVLMHVKLCHVQLVVFQSRIHLVQGNATRQNRLGLMLHLSRDTRNGSLEVLRLEEAGIASNGHCSECGNEQH